VMEDPYGYTNAEATSPQTIFAYSGLRYRIFETSVTSIQKPLSATARFVHYEGTFDNKGRHQIQEFTDSITSRYGYLWRGIGRPQDRELAIAGGELIVVDLKSGEVLGLRRGFARTGFARGVREGINWEGPEVCPRLRRQPNGRDKWPEFTYEFVSKVLRPIKAQADDKGSSHAR